MYEREGACMSRWMYKKGLCMKDHFDANRLSYNRERE